MSHLDVTIPLIIPKMISFVKQRFSFRNDYNFDDEEFDNISENAKVIHQYEYFLILILSFSHFLFLPFI